MKRTLIAAALMTLVAVPALANPCGQEEHRRLVVTGYKVGQTAVPKDQKAPLAAFAKTAKFRYGVCIFAQVDAQGSKAANERVAKARAAGVKKFLVAHGVPGKVIKIAKQEKGFTMFGLLPKDQKDDRRVVVTHE